MFVALYCDFCRNNLLLVYFCSTTSLRQNQRHFCKQVRSASERVMKVHGAHCWYPILKWRFRAHFGFRRVFLCSFACLRHWWVKRVDVRKKNPFGNHKFASRLCFNRTHWGRSVGGCGTLPDEGLWACRPPADPVIPAPGFADWGFSPAPAPLAWRSGSRVDWLPKHRVWADEQGWGQLHTFRLNRKRARVWMYSSSA